MSEDIQIQKKLVERLDYAKSALKIKMMKEARSFLNPKDSSQKICCFELKIPHLPLAKICQLMQRRSSVKRCPCRFVLWDSHYTNNRNQETLIPLFLTTEGCASVTEMIAQAERKIKFFEQNPLYKTVRNTSCKLDSLLIVQEQSKMTSFLTDLENMLYFCKKNNAFSSDVLNSLSAKIQRKIDEKPRYDSQGRRLNVIINPKRIAKIEQYLKPFSDLHQQFQKLCYKKRNFLSPSVSIKEIYHGRERTE